MSQSTRKIHYDFRGQNKYPAVAAGVGAPFCSKITAAAGAPTVQGANGGGVALTLEATNEVQNVCLYMGDILPFAIADIVRMEIVAKVGAATINAATSIAFGLANARNDAIASITADLLFRLVNDNNVVIDTKDTVAADAQAAIATGMTLGTTFKRFAIDLTAGVFSQDPPSLSLGGNANVQFFAGNSAGPSLRRVASGTRFNVSGFTGNLQLFAQIQKTASTAADSLTILEADIELKLPNA